MITITFEGDTHQELRAQMRDFMGMDKEAGPEPATEAPTPKATSRKSKAAAPATTPEDEDAELQAELNEPVEPAPAAANAVLDAGTGKPIAPADPAVVQMTFDDVRKAAAKLAVADVGKLTELLKKYGAAKLSDVPKDQLGDFAGDVMEALG